MKRGRPVKSIIRQNVIEILHHLGQGYGYEISKIYNEIYPQVTQRSVYYHLKKGVFLNEFSVHKVEKETGDFSWGSVVEKTYYTLGENANPKGEERVKEFLKRWKK
jgi:DNA-binding transcriptional ArsR family regulator